MKPPRRARRGKRSMYKYVLIFFTLLGAADLAYGLYSGDKISVLMGGVMIFIALSILHKKYKEEKKGKQD